MALTKEELIYIEVHRDFMAELEAIKEDLRADFREDVKQEIRDEAFAAGQKEGMKLGEEKGIGIGKALAFEEARHFAQMLFVAYLLKRNRVPIEIIEKATHLKREEIEKI